MDKIVVGYFQHDTISTIREVIRKSTFPWVTVCNVSPRPDDTDPYITWKDYVGDVEFLKEMYPSVPPASVESYGISNGVEVMTLMDSLKTQFAFVANLRLPLKPMGTYNYNDSHTSFIVDCNFCDWQLNVHPDDVVSCRDVIRVV